MTTITSEDFLNQLTVKVCEFGHVQVDGDVALDILELKSLHLDHVKFNGRVTGQILIHEIRVYNPSCVYISTFPLLYSGSLIKDLGE